MDDSLSICSSGYDSDQASGESPSLQSSDSDDDDDKDDENDDSSTFTTPSASETRSKPVSSTTGPSTAESYTEGGKPKTKKKEKEERHVRFSNHDSFISIQTRGSAKVDDRIEKYDLRQLRLVGNDRLTKIQHSHEHLKDPIAFPHSYHNNRPRTTLQMQRQEAAMTRARMLSGSSDILVNADTNASLQSLNVQDLSKPGQGISTGRRKSLLDWSKESKKHQDLRRSSITKQHIFSQLIH